MYLLALHRNLSSSVQPFMLDPTSSLKRRTIPSTDLNIQNAIPYARIHKSHIFVSKPNFFPAD